MVSLWGSKKDEDLEARPPVDENGDGESSGHVSQARISESNERTRLLPPPTAGGREGFLSPDDPAVSCQPLFTFNSAAPEVLH